MVEMIVLFVSPILSGHVGQNTSIHTLPRRPEEDFFLSPGEWTLHNWKLCLQIKNDSDCLSMRARKILGIFSSFPREENKHFILRSSEELQLKTSFLLFTRRALTSLALTHSNSFYIENFEPRKEMNTTSFLNFTSY